MNVVTPDMVRALDYDTLKGYVNAISRLILERAPRPNDIEIPVRDIRDCLKNNIYNDDMYLNHIVGPNSPFRAVGWKIERVTGSGDRDDPVVDYLKFTQ